MRIPDAKLAELEALRATYRPYSTRELGVVGHGERVFVDIDANRELANWIYLDALHAALPDLLADLRECKSCVATADEAAVSALNRETEVCKQLTTTLADLREARLERDGLQAKVDDFPCCGKCDSTVRAERAEAERDKLRVEVAFFAERLEKQDNQYSNGHPAAARYRALREGLEAERDRIREAARNVVAALDNRDGRAFMHHDASLAGHWKTLRGLVQP